MSQLFQIVYLSAAAKGLAPAEVDDILIVARARNASADVTGMLLYADKSFVQVLEGERTNVEATFARIARDSRHTGILVLLKQPISARNFRDWSMGFERLQPGQSADFDAVFHIDRAVIEERMTAPQADKVMVFLRSFYSAATREQL